MRFIYALTLLVVSYSTCVAQGPLVVAHRGASKDAPENTLPAFKLAWKQGADAIEGDFFLTKDNKIVCIHDKSTKRFSKTHLDVSQSSLDQLKKLDVGEWHSAPFKGTTIPTIDQVLATVPKGKKIYIEIKCGPEIVPYLIPEIKKSKLDKSQIVIISFNPDVIRQMKINAPEYKANWLSGFRKFPDGSLMPNTKVALDVLKDIKADGFSSHKNGVTQEFIQSILSAGYEYHVWTVNDISTAKKFKKWGALSITTDVPGVIKDAL